MSWQVEVAPKIYLNLNDILIWQIVKGGTNSNIIIKPHLNRDSALTYSGPVHSIDRSPPTIKDCFRISSDNLAYYNAGGRADFGPHNKGIDGRMALPIRVEVEKKKFGL